MLSPRSTPIDTLKTTAHSTFMDAIRPISTEYFASLAGRTPTRPVFIKQDGAQTLANFEQTLASEVLDNFATNQKTNSIAEIRRLVAEMTLVCTKLPTTLFSSISEETTRSLRAQVAQFRSEFTPMWDDHEKLKSLFASLVKPSMSDPVHWPALLEIHKSEEKRWSEARDGSMKYRVSLLVSD